MAALITHRPLKVGERVRVVKSTWNDNVTENYIGQEGEVMGISAVDIYPVKFGEVEIPFHRKELEVV